MSLDSAITSAKTAASRLGAEHTRAAQWQGLAKQLELDHSPGSHALLKGLLNLDPKTVLEPIYRAELAFEEERRARLYLLDYLEPKSSHSERLVSVALLNFEEPFTDIHLKASKKLHKVLESLQASASLSTPLRFADDPDFSARITVLARDAEAATALLTVQVRQILHKALIERGLTPTFLLGEKQLVLTNVAAIEEPTGLELLEHLALDLISLYGALPK